jgi:hypothetical protein
MSDKPETHQDRMAKTLRFVEATLPDLELAEWQRQFVLNMPEEMPDLRVDKRSRML